jgi:hypothetical protein
MIELLYFKKRKFKSLTIDGLVVIEVSERIQKGVKRIYFKCESIKRLNRNNSHTKTLKDTNQVISRKVGQNQGWPILAHLYTIRHLHSKQTGE